MLNPTDIALAAFFAKGGAVTKCPARDANATPLRVLRARLSQAEGVDHEERDAERRAETFGAARLNGASMSEALDVSNVCTPMDEEW